MDQLIQQIKDIESKYLKEIKTQQEQIENQKETIKVLLKQQLNYRLIELFKEEYIEERNVGISEEPIRKY